MDVTLAKQCASCKQNEVITFDNIDHMHLILFKNKYYHRDCFISVCKERVAKNNRYSLSYNEALQHVDALEKETMDRIVRKISQDSLNYHLLDSYDITIVPKYFWQMIADIESGKYKNKPCHKISMKTIYNTWCYFQHDLDGIDRFNRSHHKGPKSDADRLNYDLSIIFQRVPEYRKIIAKEEVEKEIEKQQKKMETKVNYEVLGTTSVEILEQDFYDLVDEI